MRGKAWTVSGLPSTVLLSPRHRSLPLAQGYFWQHHCAGRYKVAVAAQGAALSAAPWDAPRSRSAA